MDLESSDRRQHADFFTTLLTPRRPENSRNLSAERANSALDHRHRVTFAAVYDVPFSRKSSRFLRAIAGNWAIAPMYTFESPEYVTVLSQTDSNLNGDSSAIAHRQSAGVNGTEAASRRSLTARVRRWLTLPATRARYIVAGPGAYANGGRNTLAGRPIDNLDLNILKDIRTGERFRAQLSAQFFNALNHPQFVPIYESRG